jgi:hypothetical protein
MPELTGAMMGAMKCRVIGLLSKLVLVAASGSSQTVRPGSPSHYIEIKLPPEVNSQGFFIRYVLPGEDFGGWIQPLPAVTSYVIGTTSKGRPATGIKAVLYAPGCAIQTLDLTLSGSDNPQYYFICHPVRNTWIEGALTRSDRLYGLDVRLQAKYVARWAPRFMRLEESLITSIPVGTVAYLSADGRFRLEIPDFSQDPLAAAPDHPGEIQIWARDKNSGVVVAQLIPTGAQLIKARMGGLKIQSEYPSEIVFAPCAANPPRVHDRIGFALRPDAGDACDR